MNRFFSPGNQVGFWLIQLIALFFMIDSARAWIAEWIYPLAESSLWQRPKFSDAKTEMKRIGEARFWVPRDPRYAYRSARLAADFLKRSQLEHSSLPQELALIYSDFRRGIRQSPMMAEYHAGLALFLSQASTRMGRENRFPGGIQPEVLSELEVKRALLLSPRHHMIRFLAAVYYEEKQEHSKAQALWRSILEEDPSRTHEVLTLLFQFYGNDSFLPEIAPQKNRESLVPFVEQVLSFRTPGWKEQAYLQLMPYLNRMAEEEKIGASFYSFFAGLYERAGSDDPALYWHRRSLSEAQTKEEKASSIRHIGEVLIRKHDFAKAETFLAEHLEMADSDSAILILYVRALWYLEKKKEALDLLRNKLERPAVVPEWLEEYADLLFNGGDYQEAKRQFEKLLRRKETASYAKTHEQRILAKVAECRKKIG